MSTRSVLFRSALLLAAVVVLTFSLHSSSSAQFDPSRPIIANDEGLSRELLAGLNAWRQSEGLPPLRPNPLLQVMAEDQAWYIDYLIEQNLPIGDYHADAFGRNPRQRAAQFYQWPVYGRPDQILIGENAAVGSVRSSLNYWRGSDIHRRAALSPIYREVGVAAFVTPGDDFLFIVVFGARPNVLPVMYEPRTNSLLLTDEQSNFAPVRSTDLRIRLYNSDGIPVTDDLPWQSRVTVPPGLSERVFVSFSGPAFSAFTPVDLRRDLAIVPEELAGLPADDLFVRGSIQPAPPYVSAPRQPAVISQPTAIPFVPTRVAVQPTLQPPTIAAATLAPPTATPFVFRLPTLTPTFTPSPLPTATITPVPLDRADLLVTYDVNGLSVRAVSGAVNLTGLSFGTAPRSVTVTGWSRVASFPAAAFPRNHCLVVEQIGRATAADDGCAFVRAALTVDAGRVFWTQPFVVLRDGLVIGACASSPCAIDLP